MANVLVTGATGLIGSVIAAQLRAAGHDVRALVRAGTDAAPIEALGVEIVRGNLTDRDDLAAAVQGCRFVIHSAAIVGLPNQDPAIMHDTNVTGTLTLLDVAREAGVQRCVVLSTAACFDAQSATLTEHSPVATEGASDPYSATKRAAFEGASERVAAGQDIVFVLPGATFGPSPMGRRMVEVPGANRRLAMMLRGETADYLPASAPYSYTEDVAAASIAAMTKGEPGDRFLSLGPTGQTMTFAGFVNRGAEIAGVDTRVGEVSRDRLGDPDVLTTFGPTLVGLATRSYADPFFDDTETQRVLGVSPVPTDEALARTISWMREADLV